MRQLNHKWNSGSITNCWSSPKILSSGKNEYQTNDPNTGERRKSNQKEVRLCSTLATNVDHFIAFINRMKIIKKEMVFIKRTVSGFFYVFLLLTVGMEYSVGLIDEEKILKNLNCRVLRFTKLIFNGISL